MVKVIHIKVGFNIMKTFKYIIITINIIGFVLFFAWGYLQVINNRYKFLQKSYYGVIKDIKNEKGMRGNKTIIFTNDSIIYFGVSESTLNSYVLIGDSLAKDSAENFVKVFRKNDNKEWVKKIINEYR